jgi:hypothetical protein
MSFSTATSTTIFRIPGWSAMPAASGLMVLLAEHTRTQHGSAYPPTVASFSPEDPKLYRMPSPLCDVFLRKRLRLPSGCADQRRIRVRIDHAQPPLQQKSKPRNGAREIFVVARAEITSALHLCLKLPVRERKKYAPTGHESVARREPKQPRYQLLRLVG